MMICTSFIGYFLILSASSFFFFFFGIYLYLIKSLYLMEWLIFSLNSMKFSFIVYIDYMTLMYLSTVLMISGIVYFYSIDYMENDLYLNRFKFLLFLFMMSMCFMIISPGILSILLGWDGLGLISYCLVIYYQNKNSYNSGMLVVCCNRIGDIGLILMICILSFLGSWNLFLFEFKFVLSILMIFMMLTKSAQLPFSYWLPVAMTAPTPVSSLVHSSTLVTAGVYLLIRYNTMFIDFLLNEFLLMIFSLTMFMSGILANFEMNFKKIIALSTLSQLGFMMSILSLGLVNLGFFHLIIHAFFKSMMFMSVGGFIHMNLSIQDLRMYGLMIYLNPLKSLLLILSILNLCGFPFVSGFFSKDLILEGMFNLKMNMLNLLILYISIMLTLSYSVRLMKFILYNNKNFISYLNLGEYYNFMNIIFFYLMLFSVFLGNFYYFVLIKDKFMIMELDKILTMKMYFYGIYLVYFFNTLNLYKLNKLIKFFVSMFYLSLLMKISYVKLFEFMYMYECMFEKNMELMTSLNLLTTFTFMKFVMKFVNKIKFTNMVSLINLYMWFFFFTFFFSFFA